MTSRGNQLTKCAIVVKIGFETRMGHSIKLSEKERLLCSPSKKVAWNIVCAYQKYENIGCVRRLGVFA